MPDPLPVDPIDPKPDTSPVLPYAAPSTKSPKVLSYATPISGGMVPVRRCASQAEAEIYAATLESAGIATQVFNARTNGLGAPYSSISSVELHVLRDDAERAADILTQAESDELEPADESLDVPPPTDADGNPIDTAVAAAFDSARLLRESATVLSAMRIDTFLPTLVPRAGRSPGKGKRFLLRVRADDLDRAQAALADAEEEANEADEDDENPRCPKCRSWRTYPTGGMLQSLLRVFGAGRPEGLECLSCGYQGEKNEFLSQ